MATLILFPAGHFSTLKVAVDVLYALSSGSKFHEEYEPCSARGIRTFNF